MGPLAGATNLSHWLASSKNWNNHPPREKKGGAIYFWKKNGWNDQKTYAGDVFFFRNSAEQATQYILTSQILKFITSLHQTLLESYLILSHLISFHLIVSYGIFGNRKHLAKPMARLACLQLFDSHLTKGQCFIRAGPKISIVFFWHLKFAGRRKKKLWRKMIHRTGGCWGFPLKKKIFPTTKSDPAMSFIRPFWVATGETRLRTLGVRVMWASTSCRWEWWRGTPNATSLSFWELPIFRGELFVLGRVI